MKTENAWKKYTDTTEVFQFNEKYKAFISNCKTERECISEMISQAKAAGYRNLDDIIANKETLQAGDKVYANNMDKTLAMYIIEFFGSVFSYAVFNCVLMHKITSFVNSLLCYKESISEK